VGGLDTYKAQMQSKAAEITNAANQIQQRRMKVKRDAGVKKPRLQARLPAVMPVLPSTN